MSAQEVPLFEVAPTHEPAPVEVEIWVRQVVTVRHGVIPEDDRDDEALDQWITILAGLDINRPNDWQLDAPDHKAEYARIRRELSKPTYVPIALDTDPTPPHGIVHPSHSDPAPAPLADERPE